MNGINSIWVFVILVLNFGISWLNARTCGRAWEESKAVGGVIRVLVWCGAIQSAIGFSSVFLLPLVFAAHAIFPEYFIQPYLIGAFNLWYITIIFPALGSGLLITIESWIIAYRDRRVMNIGVAAYNTLAQIHNTAGAINSLGSAFRSAGAMVTSVATSRGDLKERVAILAVLITVTIVVIALGAGVILTAVLIRRYAGTVPLPVRSKLHQRTA